jgi:hypothetical protein
VKVKRKEGIKELIREDRLTVLTALEWIRGLLDYFIQENVQSSDKGCYIYTEQS